MSARNVAQAYVDGYYPQTHGLTLSDAVHVLATEYGLHKGDLRASIEQINSETSEPVDGSTTAVVEGSNADEWFNEETKTFLQNYP
jgi:hypothetical protein